MTRLKCLLRALELCNGTRPSTTAASATASTTASTEALRSRVSPTMLHTQDGSEHSPVRHHGHRRDHPGHRSHHGHGLHHVHHGLRSPESRISVIL